MKAYWLKPANYRVRFGGQATRHGLPGRHWFAVEDTFTGQCVYQSKPIYHTSTLAREAGYAKRKEMMERRA